MLSWLHEKVLPRMMMVRGLNRLLERVLPYIYMGRNRLTTKEGEAQREFLRSFGSIKRRTRYPLVVAMVGLVGSGKSRVARELAPKIGAAVIEGDAIRIELRKVGERYEGARKIAENAMAQILRHGGNVVLDSDHIDAAKRAELRKKVHAAGARIFFVRTVCDLDVMLGRALTADYEPKSFFGGAGTHWDGSTQEKGAVVKVREMFRRMKYHYRWITDGGGKWILRTLPFSYREIDTTNKEKMEKTVNLLFNQLMNS